LVVFYADFPEGLSAQAELVHIDGTHTTKVNSKDLNKNDETFLKQDGGFKHRAVIQFRNFLSEGTYNLKLLARDATATITRIQPRCEPYHIDFSIIPINKTGEGYHIGEDCLNSQYSQEHLVFDEVKHGKLAYPVSESTVDVAYIDLKQDGEGPFIFFF